MLVVVYGVLWERGLASVVDWWRGGESSCKYTSYLLVSNKSGYLTITVKNYQCNLLIIFVMGKIMSI